MSAALLSQLKKGIILESDVGWVHIPKINPNLIYLRPSISDMLREVLALYEEDEQGVVILYAFT